MVALSELVVAVEGVVRALPPGASACGGTSATVMAGLDLLARIARGAGEARDKEMTSVLERLGAERTRLLEAPPP